MYDAARPSPSRIYGRRWQRLRIAYLAQHPLCECEENDGAGCGRPAIVVDHRIPHNGHPVLRSCSYIELDQRLRAAAG